METANINIEINKNIYNRVKAKAALLNLNITAFIERLLDVNTQDIKYDKTLTK